MRPWMPGKAEGQHEASDTNQNAPTPLGHRAFKTSLRQP